jgi:RNA polymerase sigma-70 factor, ECF subfamily
MTSFEQLYRSYADEVYRFAYWLSGDVHEAEDVVSETFLRVWGDDDLQVATVKAYLFTIARNVLISRQRRSSRSAPLSRDPADAAASPDVQAEQRDEVNAVMRALQTLPESDRAAVIMRAELDLPYEEIARSLGIGISAAKVKVHRARLRLAALCEAKEAK